MEHLTLTALRQQLFKIVDKVIQTGVPVEIERRGHRLKIVLDDPPRKLANLRPHNAIVGDAVNHQFGIRVDKHEMTAASFSNRDTVSPCDRFQRLLRAQHPLH